MATLFLIRHGLTAQTGKILYGQVPGVELDHRGRAQAEDLARRLEPVRLTALYSSPLERCVQTVAPLAQAKRLPIVQRTELIEMDAGTWTGKPLPVLRRKKAAWAEVQSRPSAFRFPGGEGFAEAQVRVVAEVERIARRHRRGRVAVATHGDIVRILLAHFTGAPLDAFQRFVADPASVSVIEVGKAGHAYVVLMNETGGLGRFGSGAEPPWETATDGRARGEATAKVRG
jgi:probable phosphomutase (TIGR03848 family)